MTLRLNQVIALEKGVKRTAEEVLTGAYHAIQRSGPLSGIARIYLPKDEDGDKLPAESTKVQERVEATLDQAAAALTRLFDLTLTKDNGNAHAFVPLVVDGVDFGEVPVTFLLTLEKKLVDLKTLVSKLPTLDPAEEWTFDDRTNAYRSDVAETVRTKKIPRNHVRAEATDKHAAQVEIYYEDVIVGTWKTTKFSGAITEARRNELLARVALLQEGVKKAREQANMTETPDQNIGSAIFEFLGW